MSSPKDKLQKAPPKPRGGTRPGAGRPRIHHQPPVRIQVPPEIAEAIKSLGLEKSLQVLTSAQSER